MTTTYLQLSNVCTKQQAARRQVNSKVARACQSKDIIRFVSTALEVRSFGSEFDHRLGVPSVPCRV
eukprot:scaffold188235_cov63-Attheya_sp.AAC.2